MDFYEVVKTRRSIRSYRQDLVPEEVLNRVLDAVRISPSGSNRQPWKFIVMKDAELKNKMVASCNNQSFVAEAPIIIVACGYNIHHNRGGYMGDLSVLVDISIAFTHLILAARAEGLGTCWIGAFNNEEVKKILNVPKDVNIVAITPLGYPKSEEFTEVKQRKSLAEIISLNKF